MNKNKDWISINDLFHNYRDFLNKSWGTIEKVEQVLDWDEDFDFSGDWMRANLELLVVRVAAGPYANLECRRDRMINPELSSTHELIVTSKSNKNDLYIFSGLCTKKEDPKYTLFSIRPPFDYVALFKVGDRFRNPVYLHVDEVDFFLQELEPKEAT